MTNKLLVVVTNVPVTNKLLVILTNVTNKLLVFLTNVTDKLLVFVTNVTVFLTNATDKLLVFLTNVTKKLFLVRRWGRPPLPELDAAKDALVFQQLELDHYIGELFKGLVAVPTLFLFILSLSLHTF